VGSTEPSADATSDIPPLMLRLFIHEASRCPGLPWTVMAAVSKVETDHGRHGGSQLQPDGTITPRIVGPALDGTGGNAAITDTDQGIWDNDTVWDRATGPFQFIPTSWRIYGTDGNGDSIADPHNVYDGTPAMRRHLCPDGNIADLNGAIYAYNHSDAYVDAVLSWAKRYSGDLLVAPTVGGYALPVNPALVNDELLARPHHDYPAWDFSTPVGTPVYAITQGEITTAISTAGIYPTDPNRCGNTLVLAGDDGATYTYCHLHTLNVDPGQHVPAGQRLGTTGGQPGTPGAGNTTGPHLHLGLRVNGTAVCPQPLLLAIHRGEAVSLSDLPIAGCTT
jgi:hypothetical protein